MGFFGFFKKERQRDEDQPQASNQSSSDEISMAMLSEQSKVSELPGAAWPPVEQKIPAIEVSRIINAKAKEVRDLLLAVPLTNEEKEHYLFPAIVSLARFVHLLPASENDHHRGTGGLFAHTIEVALFSANAAKQTIFASNEAPRFKYENHKRWILASVLVAIVHDIGKAVCDMTVSNAHGVWNPSLDALVDWLHKTGSDGYFLTWNSERNYRDHAMYSLAYCHRIIPEQTLKFVMSTHNRVLEREMYGALNVATPVAYAPITEKVLEKKGHSSGSLRTILCRAEALSIKLDQERSQHVKAQFKVVAYPIAEKIVLLMKELVKSKVWRVNQCQAKDERGKDHQARIFVVHEGCFIRWDELNDFFALCRTQGIQDIPQDKNDVLALLERSGLIEQQHSNGGVDTYWHLVPLFPGNGEEHQYSSRTLTDPLLCIKLSEARLLFPHETLIDPLDALIWDVPPAKHVAMKIKKQFGDECLKRVLGDRVVTETYLKTLASELEIDDSKVSTGDGGRTVSSENLANDEPRSDIDETKSSSSSEDALESEEAEGYEFDESTLFESSFVEDDENDYFQASSEECPVQEEGQAEQSAKLGQAVVEEEQEQTCKTQSLTEKSAEHPTSRDDLKSQLTYTEGVRAASTSQASSQEELESVSGEVLDVSSVLPHAGRPRKSSSSEVSADVSKQPSLKKTDACVAQSASTSTEGASQNREAGACASSSAAQSTADQPKLSEAAASEKRLAPCKSKKTKKLSRQELAKIATDLLLEFVKQIQTDGGSLVPGTIRVVDQGFVVSAKPLKEAFANAGIDPKLMAFYVDRLKRFNIDLEFNAELNEFTLFHTPNKVN